MKPNKKTILIIDDDPIFIQGIKENLQFDGFSVLEAFDGLTGYKLAKKNKPDLIILDVMMPKLDGFKVCSMLKKDLQTKDISVIMFTSVLNTPEGEEKAMELADALLIKGKEYTELLSLIQTLI
jgi:CheY-like chemotaxis protein